MTTEKLDEITMSGANQFGITDIIEQAIFHEVQMAVSDLMSKLGEQVEAHGDLSADRWMMIQAAAFYSMTRFLDETMKENGL